MMAMMVMVELLNAFNCKVQIHLRCCPWTIGSKDRWYGDKDNDKFPCLIGQDIISVLSPVQITVKSRLLSGVEKHWMCQPALSSGSACSTLLMKLYEAQNLTTSQCTKLPWELEYIFMHMVYDQKLGEQNLWSGFFTCIVVQPWSNIETIIPCSNSHTITISEFIHVVAPDVWTSAHAANHWGSDSWWPLPLPLSSARHWCYAAGFTRGRLTTAHLQWLRMVVAS